MNNITFVFPFAGSDSQVGWLMFFYYIYNTSNEILFPTQNSYICYEFLGNNSNVVLGFNQTKLKDADKYSLRRNTIFI